MIIDYTDATPKDEEALKEITAIKSDNKSEIDFSNTLVSKPWGEEYLLYENSDVAIWILHIEPNHSTSMHAHPNKNTSLICLDSKVTCETLDDKHYLDSQRGIYLGKKVFHQTSNHTDSRAIVMEIETPVDKFDLVRLHDKYEREKLSYESRKNYSKKSNLTLKNMDLKPLLRKFGKMCVTIGFAKNKDELLKIYNSIDEKVVATLLDRNIWDNRGSKKFEVGQIIELNEMILNNYEINDNFNYLIISKDNNE